MAENLEPERVARNESMFREVNERIAESAGRIGAGDAEFVCECADPACVTRVQATLEEYERVRADGATFLLAPGHEEPGLEAVVEREDEHSVVEKTDPQAEPVARELDPRTV